jgi:hypothetical protein
MATKIHIQIDQGTDVSKAIYHVRDAYGNIVSMLGFIGICNLRKNYTATNAYSFSVTFNANGDVILSANSSQTANMTPGRYVYDVAAKNTSTGEVERIVEGFAYISPAVAKFNNLPGA